MTRCRSPILTPGYYLPSLRDSSRERRKCVFGGGQRFQERTELKVLGAIRLHHWTWLVIGFALAGMDVSGQEPAVAQAASSLVRSDTSALTALFDEQHIVESGFSVRRRAAQAAPNERFTILRSWVIPDPSAARFRVTADFAAAGADNENLPDAAHLVSPASQLVRLAGELNQIDPLRAMIAACPPAAPTEELDRLTLLALLAMEANEEAGENSLEKWLDQWFQRIQLDRALLDHSTAGLVLLAQAANEKAHPSPLIREMLRFATHAYRAEYNRPAWLRHLVALSAKLEAMEQAETIRTGTAPADDSAQWHLANLERAFEHGSAFPDPLWQLQGGRYRNLSNYGDLLLFFQSPLLGDFSVEATATGLGYREAHLMVGGHWTGLVFNHKQILLGNPRGELGRPSITPPLQSTDRYGLIRTRIDVQDQNAATWMNGRQVHQQPLLQADCPWLAVRTNYRVQGGVDDLRITGEPIIPERLTLVDSPSLLGWYDYYQPPGGASDRLADWRVSFQADETGNPIAEISSPQSTQLTRGSYVERLLRYLRPIIEDGTLAFDFFYEPGQTAAYPVIGRHAYLLTAQGVQRHRLTDGRFDRTELRPDNTTPIGASDNSELPLLVDQWNHVEVERRGDSFMLVLNGQTVCEEQRTRDTAAPQFGIFHFADQTALRVRNLSWTGRWPKALPELADQQLADPLEKTLAWTAEQPGQSFQHFFNEESITSGAFMSVQGSPTETAKATSGGLVMRQTSDDGYRGATITPTIEVSGDFDVMVAFDQMELQSAMKMIAAIEFGVQADTNAQDVAAMQCVQDRSNIRIVQCLRMLTVDNNARRSYFGREPADGSGGRLKLCRRGEMIYYLAADNDSNRFRLVGQEAFPKADLQQHGIRLGVQAQGPKGIASVRFKELSVRAERLSGGAIHDHQQLLMELKQRGSELPIGFRHDFAKQPPADHDFMRWGGDQAWRESGRGLEIVSVGADSWNSAGMAINRGFSGDFDIATQFSLTQFPTPKKGDLTQVFLQLDFSDADRTQVSSILTKDDAGDFFCQMQVRYSVDGRFVYKTIGNQSVENADQLRIVRRGKDVYGIAGSRSSRSEALLGTTELTDAPIAQRGARALLHTGGAGRTAKMFLESIHVRAAAMSGSNQASATAPVTQPTSGKRVPKPPQPQSLPGRLFDSFRKLSN